MRAFANSLKSAVASCILNGILYDYIIPIRPHELEIGIRSGILRIANVKMKSTALSALGLPFTVHEGIFTSLLIRFPWRSLESQPCRVEISGLHLTAELNHQSSFLSPALTREAILSTYQKPTQVESEESGSLNSQVQTILANFILSIHDIHIRLELSVRNIQLAIGVMIKSIESHPIDQSGNLTFVRSGSESCRRLLRIEGLNIDFEPDFSPLRTVFASSWTLKDLSITRKAELRGAMNDSSVEVDHVPIGISL
jgi:vacuolar protein sorting-associated protein 13A/C